MTEIDPVRTIDGAELVKAEWISGMQIIQAWYGGTQVRVINLDAYGIGTWAETEIWTLSDEEGKPVSQDEIEHHMAMTFENIREEMEGENR